MKKRYTAVYSETVTRYDQFFIEAEDMDEARHIANGLEGTDTLQLVVLFEDESDPEPFATYEVTSEELILEACIF